MDAGEFTRRVFQPSAEDILADDWETEPAPVTVTREQFWEAVRDAHCDVAGKTTPRVMDIDVDALARRLGLGD